MRAAGSGAVSGTATAGRAGRRGPVRGGFMLGPAPGAAAPAGAVPAPVLGSESLLAVQVAAAPPGPAAAMARAEAVLDGLGILQAGLLRGDGGADRAALEALSGQVAQARDAATDPALSEILDAVALRAAVELARRGWSGGAQGGG